MRNAFCRNALFKRTADCSVFKAGFSTDSAACFFVFPHLWPYLPVTGREATAFMKYHKGSPLAESCKEGSVYGRIPYEPGFLMILQVAKRIANIRFTQRMLLLRSSRTHIGLLLFFFLRIHAHKEVCKNCTGNIMPYTKYCTRDRCKRICCKMRGCK